MLLFVFFVLFYFESSSKVTLELWFLWLINCDKDFEFLCRAVVGLVLLILGLICKKLWKWSICYFYYNDLWQDYLKVF